MINYRHKLLLLHHDTPLIINQLISIRVNGSTDEKKQVLELCWRNNDDDVIAL